MCVGLELTAGGKPHPSSEQLKQGLPSFYRQIIEVIDSAGYQSGKDSEDPPWEGQGGRSAAREMRSTLARAKVAFEAIRRGTVGTARGTARSVESSLARLEKLIDQSFVAGNGRVP